MTRRLRALVAAPAAVLVGVATAARMPLLSATATQRAFTGSTP